MPHPPATTRLAAAGLLAAAAMLLPAAATAQQPPYPPSEAEVACDQTATEPGDPPFCAARGFAPASQVTVTLTGPLTAGTAAGGAVVVATVALAAPVAVAAPAVVAETTVTADGEGIAQATVPVPAGTTPGTYRMTFAGSAPDGSAHEPSTTVEVLPAGELTTTGAGVTRALVVVAVLVGVGALLVYAARRHDRRSGGEVTAGRD